ncbi:hypothetical protein EOS93_18980 [Rhizobium sp. RMa-01]|nr:hypothetical protein BBJ66_16960 [Rhizobium sp. RSm-3]RVU09536.1 hypothetical protein EOS93_18980 [Rhizobium sp. RMa-01]
MISRFKPIPKIYSLFSRNYGMKFLYKIYGERILVLRQPTFHTLALGKAGLPTANGEDTK